MYNVRSNANKGAPPKPPSVSVITRPITTTSESHTIAKMPAAEAMTPKMVFVRLALDIGLQEAMALLVAVDEKLAALVASVG